MTTLAPPNTGLSLPAPIKSFFSAFPLKTYPSIVPPSKAAIKQPTLWIEQPREKGEVLSRDVECLKWQAYLALRGLKSIALSTSVSPDGAIDGRLPDLHVPLQVSLTSSNANLNDDGNGELLAAHLIPTWVDGQVDDERGSTRDELEGYRDASARDESRAWVKLLEGTIHSALILHTQPPFSLKSLTSSTFTQLSSADSQFKTLLTPPPAPLTGVSSFLPSYGTKLDVKAIEGAYREAVGALSERLGADRWMLGSEGPTALDALLFAYLHTLLHEADVLRVEVTRRVNLVAWELKLRPQIRAAFVKQGESSAA